MAILTNKHFLEGYNIFVYFLFLRKRLKYFSKTTLCPFKKNCNFLNLSKFTITQSFTTLVKILQRETFSTSRKKKKGQNTPLQLYTDP